MKIIHIFLLASFLLITNILISQVWSLAELIKVVNMNVDDADTFISSKGWSYDSAEPKDYGVDRIYAYNKTAYENLAPYWFYIYSYNETHGYKMGVSWQTSKTQQYSNFKKQIKPNGFIFLSSIIRLDGSTSFFYIKGKYFLEIRCGDFGDNVLQHVIILKLKK